MLIIYDLIFLIFVIIYLPVYLFKGKFHRGFLSRLGILPSGLKLNHPIWVHAVSVGEAVAMRGLVEGLRKKYPDKKIVISTVTATGNKIAKAIAQEGDLVTYLPLDFSFIVRRVIDKIKPVVFIIAETEIWPNLINCLYKQNIPVITVNARISDASFKGYLFIRLLIKPILRKVTLFCAQTERDKERLMALGVDEARIKVTGNMKFDALSKKGSGDCRNYLGLNQQDKLLAAGSTHAQEEEVILSVYRELLKNFPNLSLLIAPRHPARAVEIVKLTEKFGFKPQRISLLNSGTGKRVNGQTVFILDTIGELTNYYAASDIVFVGGSLVKTGGHNILEPASLGKPVLFGPYMFNFRDIAELFLKDKAAIRVYNRQELKEKISELLNNPDQILQLALKARELIFKNQGATAKNIELIKTKKAYGD
ncbi:MAG: 3-deoxy-D-manno-octulosonic acid transferase [Candidatus Omnitrophica bacterium]|nr:3-deoxy-D-manno-octulosonic acid transferase [Candidatus Omnitrophota bacterium]